MSLLGARNPSRPAERIFNPAKRTTSPETTPPSGSTNVPMYGKVRMKGVYPGVDLVYYGHRGELEYDFVVAPGADASAIKLRFDGAKAALAANGDLVLPVDGGPELRFDKPVVYQIKNGARQPVEGSFAIADGKQGQQVSFQLGAYDHSRELVIDPTFVLLACWAPATMRLRLTAWQWMRPAKSSSPAQPATWTFPLQREPTRLFAIKYSAVAAANDYVRCGWRLRVPRLGVCHQDQRRRHIAGLLHLPAWLLRLDQGQAVGYRHGGRRHCSRPDGV